MKNELISVIVPIYNVEKYLPKCIDSIINQTYKNIEIILIDDGSTDSCGLICDKYKKIDNRIVVIHSDNNGLSSARNKGLDIAKGNYISFVDSDDYLETDMFLKLKNNMERNNSEISICNVYYVKDDNREIVNKISSNKEYVFDNKEKFKCIQNEFGSIIVYAWNKLYKRNIFDNIRYPEGRIYEDSYILCDILDKANKISFTLKPLYNYVYRENSIVNSFSINHFDKIESFNKKIDFYNNEEYYDMVYEEKKRKMNVLVAYLSKMKRYKIKNKEVFNKYYKELLDTNNDVKWKDANKKVKLFKIFRKPSINALAFLYRVRDLVKR